MEWAIIGGAAIFGAILAASVAASRSRRAMEQARAAAEAERAEAERAASLIAREAESAAREARVRVAAEAEDERRSAELEKDRSLALIHKKEARVEQRAAQVEARQIAIDGRFAELRRQKNAARAVRQEAKEQRGKVRQELERIAETTAEELMAQMVERMVEDTRSQGADRLRNLESVGAEEFSRQAKRAMGIAMQRYTGHCMRDRTSTTMALPDGAARRLREDAASQVSWLEERAKMTFSIAEDGRQLRLESGDGVARELCRRVLARLGKDGPVRDIERIYATAEKELRKEIRVAGREAFSKLHLARADDEIVDLLGQLNYRTSYTQNQWRHAIEASHLGGMVAAELGLDPVVARRAALLHDIGKALTHQVDGTHAVIGAEIARRCGEDEVVANAVGAHHGEEPANTAYAPLVAAADAMSGGRPGARREIVEAYGDRIGDLEKIAHSFKGVTSVHAVQAGRELRIHVDQKRIGDDQLEALSEQIAAKISDEMTFPGQIRVTVIREYCAVEYAS